MRILVAGATGAIGRQLVPHLQRLAAGQGPNGRPLGPVRPETARLLEHIFEVSVDVLLAPPAVPPAAQPIPGTAPTAGRLAEIRTVAGLGGQHALASAEGVDLDAAFNWLDERAGWVPDTARRKVATRLARLDARTVHDQAIRRTRVARGQVARALFEYYGVSMIRPAGVRVRCDGVELVTSMVTRPEWLELACPLTPDSERLRFVRAARPATVLDDVAARWAVHRLAEAAELGVRIASAPLYRLLDVEVSRHAITGGVGLVPFDEYALTMDLLEGELVDAVLAGRAGEAGALPMRDRYLPDLATVFDLPGRLCAGGVLALCAIARPADPYRGLPDYALLVQERSGYVLNGARRLAVIPKGFHQPLRDARADARIGATLLREMEEELFGRGEVDSTAGEQRVAAPMHPGRLSDPMRWLLAKQGRLRTECTGFGLNLVSGNCEFAGLVVIDDAEFWSRFGGQIEANWEAAGLRLYSSLDRELLADLTANESWSNEGLFALAQGLRRLGEIGGSRVDVPAVELTLS
jgi:hypothetical protein